MYNNYVDPDVAIDAQTWHDMNEEAVENSATSIPHHTLFSDIWSGILPLIAPSIMVLSLVVLVWALLKYLNSSKQNRSQRYVEKRK